MQSKDFLKAYIDLIARAGEMQTDWLWYATDAASKNRFQSDLPERMQSFLKTGHPGAKGCVKEALTRMPRIVRHAVCALKRASLARKELGDVFAGKFPAEGLTVLRTFCYDHSFPEAGGFNDPFFAGLVPYLASKRPLLVVADVLGDYELALKAMKACPDLTVVPWEYFLDAGDIWRCSCRLSFWSPRSFGKLSFAGKDVTQAAGRYLSGRGSRIQPLQFFQYPAMRNLFTRLKAERLIMTYEANPWERMTIKAVREVSPKTRVLGYQHNILPQASANMFIAEGEVGRTPLPDMVLTVGDEPRRILKENAAYPESMLRTACSLRMPALFAKALPRSLGQRLLVAMEGVDAVHHMARYVIEELRERADIEVVFRTHPVLPWSYFEGRYGLSIKGVGHFRISGAKTLKEDLEAADAVMYWGTAVSVEALALGRPLIHFDNGGPLSFDPLFMCSYLKWCVRDKGELVPALKDIFSMSDADYSASLEKARQYLSGYFTPPDEKTMEVFLA
jgi:hypothetical protein